MNLLRRLVAGALVGSIGTLAFVSPVAADPIRDAQWHLAFLNVAETHKHSQGESVVVGLVDTGVDTGHPDLGGSILPGMDFTPDGGDGQKDVDGHGTAMAGIIAGHGRVLGIAPGAKILPVRDHAYGIVPGSPGRAIDWATDNGARVLCLAFVQEGTVQTKSAIERALAKDIVVVAAIGNTPYLPGFDYPAGYSGVIGSAGVDKSGNRAAISISSPHAILAAPAVDIASTDTRIPGNTGYRSGTGTSDATAIIAGAAALVRAKYPNLSATEVIHRLTATADDKGPAGRDDEYGYGIVNLVKALTADVPPLLPSASATKSPTNAGPPQGGGGKLRTFVVIGALVLAAALVAAFVTVALRRRRTG